METLSSLIADRSWEEALERLKEHPEEAKQFRDPSSDFPEQKPGSKNKVLPLHEACAARHTPTKLVEALLEAYPESASMQTTDSLHTPLHLLCQNNFFASQKRWIKKFALILNLCGPQGLEIRNYLDRTVLHAACRHGVTLDILKLIVHTNPSLLLDFGGESAARPLDYLVGLRIQSLGFPALDNALWKTAVEKISFLAHEEYKLLGGQERTFEQQKRLVAHVMLKSQLLRDSETDAFKWIVTVDKSLLLERDENGNLPVHVALARECQWPAKLVTFMMDLKKETTNMRDGQGRTPLSLAVKNKPLPVVKRLLLHNPLSVYSRDGQSFLYPFLLAATRQDRAVEATYECLRFRPDPIQDCIKSIEAHENYDDDDASQTTDVCDLADQTAKLSL